MVILFDAFVLEGDIKGCFDHISHQWMLEHVPMDRTFLQKWLKAGSSNGLSRMKGNFHVRF